jgi:hypothetical protein
LIQKIPKNFVKASKNAKENVKITIDDDLGTMEDLVATTPG